MASNDVLFDQQQTGCAICLNQFQIPKALACLHTFCQDCIQCYINKNFNHRDRTFPCPLCRHVCRLDPSTKNASKIPIKELAKHLPTNFHIINLEETERKKKAAESQDAVSRNYLDKIEDLEKQIFVTKRLLEKKYRYNMISVQVFKQEVQFCPYPPSDDYGYLNPDMENCLKKMYDISQEKHTIMDKFLVELEGIRTDIINHILPDNRSGNNRKKRRKQNRTKSSAGGFDAIKTKLHTYEKNLEASFEEMSLDESENELVDIMDRLRYLWCTSKDDPQEINTTKCPLLFLKVPKNQDHYLSIDDHIFPNLDHFVFICSVKVMTNDTVVVCGKCPNLLLGYDANSGMMTSRLKLSGEPTNMSVLNDLDVMVTFSSKTDIEIIKVFSPKPFVQKILDTGTLYSQVICLHADDDGTHKILALAEIPQRYDVIQFGSNSLPNHLEILSTGRVPDHYSDSRFVYMKQKDVVVFF